nr:hypothetical protein [Azomonas macrocytogenes]
MRGRLQASLVVVAAAAAPMLFWLSAAAGSLVLLRRGLSDGLGVVAWALLPALAWWFFGDPRPVLVVGGTLILALTLRKQASWRNVLLYSIALGVLYSQVLGAVFGESIAVLAAEVQKLLPEALPGVWDGMSAEQQEHLLSVFIAVMTGLLGALLQTLAVLSLMLGRYWQATLYNPGGFGHEFRELRFSPMLAIALFAIVLMAPNFGPQAAILTPLCSVPLAFACLALVHGLVAQGRLARFWLVGLYVAMLLFLQFIYPLLAVLAVVDSLFDFRGRIPRGKNEGPTDGEG